VELTTWDTAARPGFHAEGPQGLIDDVLKIRECDAFIGIFWKRFGTPVLDSLSGTAHEFTQAYDAWKSSTNRTPEIVFYFKEKSYSPKTAEETDQWGTVLKFKKTFPREGLWWNFKEKREFEKLARVHLTKLIQERCRPDAPGSHDLDSLFHQPVPTTLTNRLDIKEAAALIDDRPTNRPTGQPIRWCEHILLLIPEFERTLYLSLVACSALLCLIFMVLLLSSRTAPTPVVEQQEAMQRLFLIGIFASGTAGTIRIAYSTGQKIAHARAIQRQYLPWKQSCDESRRAELAAMCKRIGMNFLH
jgi:hypothetical protein